MLIVITLLFTQISDGQSALLQGTRQTKYLAQTNLYGSLLGLFISIPLYYVLGEGGIVPAIILSAASILLLNWFFASKVPVAKVKVDKATMMSDGKKNAFTGFYIKPGLAGLVLHFLCHQGIYQYAWQYSRRRIV